MIRSFIVGSCMLGAAFAAQAQVATSAFTITGVSATGGAAGYPILLSDTGGVAEFSFGGSFAYYSQAYDSRGYTTATRSAIDFFNQAFTLQVRDGYTITGISFMGTVDGYLTAPTSSPAWAGPVSTPGTATNRANASVALAGESDAAHMLNVTSPQSFEASLDGLDLQGTFQMNLAFDSFLQNTPSSYQYCLLPSPGGCSAWVTQSQLDYHAGLRTGDMRFEVTTAAIAAPVPEPATYGLMLAGLGFMGAWARRRRQG